MDTNDIIRRSGLSNYISGCDNFPSYRLSINKEFDNRYFYDAYSYAVKIACVYEFCISYSDLITLYRLSFPFLWNGSPKFRDYNFRFMYTADDMPDFTSVTAKKISDVLSSFDYTNPDKVWLAANVHKKLITLHPFQNGNGRISRLCMNSILLRFGYYPIFVTNDWAEEYCVSQDLDRKFGGNTFELLIKQKVIENEKRRKLNGI